MEQTLEPQQQIGHDRVLGKPGEGGTGEAYLAQVAEGLAKAYGR